MLIGGKMAEYIRVAETAGFNPGMVKHAEVAGRAVAIANVDGEYYAIESTCTHVGGPLVEGELSGAVLTCPWHGGQFDVRTGQALRPPPRTPERVYPVKVEGEVILIEVPEA
jgi:nitrite reductase/ring-hydroxylating ferredoxin subunit